MPTKLWAVLTAAGVAIAAPSFAHHSFAVDYDANKPVKVTGVVTKVEWTNPHAHYYIDVMDEQGKRDQLELRAGYDQRPAATRMDQQSAQGG